MGWMEWGHVDAWLDMWWPAGTYIWHVDGGLACGLGRVFPDMGYGPYAQTWWENPCGYLVNAQSVLCISQSWDYMHGVGPARQTGWSPRGSQCIINLNLDQIRTLPNINDARTATISLPAISWGNRCQAFAASSQDLCSSSQQHSSKPPLASCHNMVQCSVASQITIGWDP